MDSVELLLIVASYAGALCLGWFAKAGADYVGRKAQNKAQIEDVPQLIDAEESAKLPYRVDEETRQARHHLRLAAIDQRLRAHQEAFTLWRKLLGAMHSEDVGKVVLECQSWWEKNCLYLEPSVREAFVRAYSAAHVHESLLKSRAETKTIQNNWSDILAASKAIFDAVNLPPLTEVERKDFPKAE